MKIQLSDKKKACLFWGCICAGLFLFLFLAGEKGYYEYSDSFQYLELNQAEGVMPGYPFFITLHWKILGEELYLYGVIVSQTIIAVGSIMSFGIWIRKRFGAGYLVTGLSMVVSVYPFLLDFPKVLVNHSILTEALTYPFFYLFTIMFAESMLRKRCRWVFGVLLSGLILAMLRTQMQICFGFAAFVIIYMLWRRRNTYSWLKRGILLLFSLMCGGLLIIFGEFVMLKGNVWLWEKNKQLRESGHSGISQISVLEDSENEEESKQATEAETDNDKDTENGSLMNRGLHGSQGNVIGQFNSILLDRTLYEMDEKDVDLFDDQETQILFQKFYEKAETSGARYVYAKRGLWMWRDIMNGIAGGTYTVLEGWKEFRAEVPNSALNENWREASSRIAFALLREHWPRMLLHTLCMLPQGFICTVFIQKEAIYGLCHLYTLVVYLSAIFFVIIGFRKKIISEERCEFLLASLFLNGAMVIVISIVFFGMQRYLVYGFGVFYAAYLLILEQLWNDYGRKIWGRRKDRF